MGTKIARGTLGYGVKRTLPQSRVPHDPTNEKLELSKT